MILQSLMQYYESLVEKGKVPRMGWCHAKVSCAIELDEDGQISNRWDYVYDNKGRMVEAKSVQYAILIWQLSINI